MKVVSVTPHVLCAPADVPFQSAFSTFTHRWACLVEIACDDGTIGWGECLGPSLPNAALVRAMAPLVVGRDPRLIEPIWADVYNQFRDQGQRGATMTAQSGIDIALWDILGQHHGAPVHALLGGAFRERVPAYATGGFRPVGQDRDAALAEELRAHVAAGFAAAKIKIGYGVEADAASVRLARAVLGPDRALMIDANHGYDAIEAVALGHAVAGLGVAWFEEPVTPEHLGAYADVRARQPLPVAAGETWHGRAAFAEAVSRRAVDILQPDVCGCGGITEMKKIVSLAETAGVRVVPHVWGTGVAVAASLHMLATLPPWPMRHRSRDPWLEFDRTPDPYRMAVIGGGFALEDGHVAVPQGPGLGVTVERAVIERFRVAA